MTVVDPETRRPLADGQIGEIWITGPLVCRGYWNRPLETAATFHASIAGQAGRYLRTGDLGFIAERELHITGRCKDVIIVGGGNHYPQDIEYSVERSHPAVRAGSTIAFSIDNGHEEEVIVVTVVGPVGRPESSRSTPAEIERTIRAAVARDHEIGVHTVAFVCPSELPRTSSGKLQRGVCRRRYEEGTLSCVWETPRRRARP